MGRFAELLSHDGVEEDLELRSAFGFMAFHGGNLEEGTDLVAHAAAKQSGASLYAVRQPVGLRWHIPSIEVTPDDSPALARFLDHVEVVVCPACRGAMRILAHIERLGIDARAGRWAGAAPATG